MASKQVVGFVCPDCKRTKTTLVVRGRCCSCYTNVRRAKVRDRAIAMLGGKCGRCGESFPACVYDFHHKDPATKLDDVGSLIVQASLGRIWREVEKCDLLCANCHRIVEYGS